LNRFDRTFWKRVWSLVRLYWLSADRRRGVKLLIIVAILNVIGLALGAYGTYLSRDFTNALLGKLLNRFYHVMLLAVAVTMTGVLVKVFGEYSGGLLFIEWREWLTHYFVDRGFAHRAFYRMSLVGKIDNPDQRIADDISSFVEWTERLTITMVFALAGVVTYFAILWSISSPLALFLIAYAIAGTYFSVVIGRRLIGLNYFQERYQGDFRFGLVHVRDNIEPIFIYGGERQETNQLRHRFAAVVRNFKDLIRWKRNLGFLTDSYGGMATLIPFSFLAAAYVAGRLQFGQVAQAAAAFASLHIALSVIVTSFPDIAQYANVVVRLGEYLEETDAAREFDADADNKMIEIADGPGVALDHLTVMTPAGGKTLIRNLSVDASALAPLLVQGPSGTGKTSLMRALSGIWREGNGTVTRPPLADVIFLPQRPYMVLGSLRDQLTYPKASAKTDDQLYAMLRTVNLSNLPERFGGLDVEMHWVDVLSPGEQQRLAFARLLLNRPRFAFLDEATSALDVANERLMYELLSRHAIPFLSSGHRPTLLKFHRNVLQLSLDREWKIEASHEFEVQTAA
jgi:vitamin B12/bleomycin/antimicrobial peptide transport system ATP-binding/permease protein